MFISSFLQVTSSKSAAQISPTSLSLTVYRHEPNSLFRFFIHRIGCFLCGALIGRSSSIRSNTTANLNSNELSGAMARETITISSVASPEPRIVTLDSGSNEPTVPYGFGSQHPIVPPSLTDLNLPPKLFNVLATMTVIQADDAYSDPSPEPSIPSPISTPPMNVSSIEGWETTHTTTDDATFYFDDDPRRVYWDISSSDTFDSNEPRNVSVAAGPSSTPPPPRRQKRKLSVGISFPKKGECRSIPARHATNPYQPERHPDAQENSNII